MSVRIFCERRSRSSCRSWSQNATRNRSWASADAGRPGRPSSDPETTSQFRPSDSPVAISTFLAGAFGTGAGNLDERLLAAVLER